MVGLYEDEAMMALQQAGLAVSVKRIKQDDVRYRHREGRVVRQKPGAGGVAMVGSTVVITVYKWTPRAEDEEDETHDDGDAGDWTSSQVDEQEAFPEEEEEVESWGEADTGGWIPPGPEGIEPRDDESPCGEEQISDACGN